MVGLPRAAIEGLRASLDAGREALSRRTDLSGMELARETTALVDRIVAELAREAARAVRPGGTAILALGGYGRCELSPHSDIDLLFLIERPEVQAYVDAILYGLWDLRFEVGHAVRTLAETMEAARDHSVLTSLLEARWIPIGDGEDEGRGTLFADLASALEKELATGERSPALIREKLEEAQRRRARFGSSVYLLEPNVKESEGGLREVHTARWIAQARWRVKTIAELVPMGVLSLREQRIIERSYGFLLRVRAELHLSADRRQDILSFSHQETVAGRLGFIEREGTQKAGIERFMRAYYHHARQLRIHAQSIVERATTHHVRHAVHQHAPGGFELWQGMLTVAERRHFEADPTALVRIFQVAQEESLEIYSYTKELIASCAGLIDAELRRDRRVVRPFLELLEDPNADGSILDLMHDLGILRRLIPEASRMTARWQHSLYHVYTVDAHSLFVVKNLKRLRAGGFSETEQEQEMTRLMSDLPRPVVLYLAAFLHDIGKGWRQGDHASRGARVAEAVGRRLEEARLPSWTAEETQDLVWLVKEHLLMSALSQRRDLEDRGLLEGFAEQVRTSERLAMLYLLTFADMRGTSPKVWTEWKGSLLSQLYHRVRAVLDATVDDHEQQRRRRAEAELIEHAPELREIAAEFTRLAPARYIMSFQPAEMARHLCMWRDVSNGEDLVLRLSHRKRDDVTELTIACPDRPRLLAMLAGTLAANSLQILSAQIYSLGNIALDVVCMKGAPDHDRWERVRADLSRVFSDDDVEELIEARVRESTLEPRAQPEVETKLVIINDASDTETVIDVFCADHLGVLYTISQVLADQGLSISLAKISTEGNRVADGFYVTDAATGGKIRDPVRLEAIKDAVKRAVTIRDGRGRWDRSERGGGCLR